MPILKAKNRKPSHPGAILREDILPSLKMTQTELAERLGVSRRTVSHIVHERRPLTTDMAIRLAQLLGTSPESWLNMQRDLEIWKLQCKNACIYNQIAKIESELS